MTLPTTPPKKTLRQQFQEVLPMPTWAFICMVCACGLAGYGAGLKDRDTNAMSPWLAFGLAGVFYFAILVPGVLRAIKRKPRALAADKAAVSPVIGVILMVAITVILAAIVFVLVSNLSKNSNTMAPNMAFNQDEKGHTLTVVSADPAADWSQVKATLTGTGCTYKLNNGASTNTNAALTTAALPVTAGDTITVANSGAGTCTLKLIYSSVNQLLGSWAWSF